MALLYYYDYNPFRIFLSCFFFNLVIPGRSKALISTRKRNPEDSGRSSKMASACQWPFSFFLLASSLLNSSFYFNHWGTLQSSAVVSYDIINIDKKLNLFALRQKIEFGLFKKWENFVITRTLKMPTAFGLAIKSSAPFILTAILRWVTLFRERYQLTLLVSRKISRVWLANRVLKMKKKQESLLQALIKRDMLLVASCCTRIFVSVISSCFVSKGYKRFFVQKLLAYLGTGAY